MRFRYLEVENAFVLSPEQGRVLGRETGLIRMDPKQVILEPLARNRVLIKGWKLERKENSKPSY
jgi:hypothetical protein